MNNRINKWLSNPSTFQYSFFLILFINTILFYLNLEKDQLYVFFIPAIIFLGIGFFEKTTKFLLIMTTLVVTYLFFLMPEKLTVVSFLTVESIYLLLMIISVGLMKRNQKIKRDSLELILALSKTLDSRDTYTSNHSQNVAWYATEIAKKMKLPKNECEAIYKGGLLHDIGKIGIPENILMKEGKLTSNEYMIVKEHPVIGNGIIEHISDFAENGVLDIVLYHHERYDGKGYPSGLVGKNIPLAARIIAIADTFDAMTTKRVYRNEIDLETTLKEIKKSRGTQFDPDIADVFLGFFKNENDKIKIEKQIKVNKIYQETTDIDCEVS
jgi:HD-GYP domain-containing protein (c-di-GMP phosphodiesterase class II)